MVIDLSCMKDRNIREISKGKGSEQEELFSFREDHPKKAGVLALESCNVDVQNDDKSPQQVKHYIACNMKEYEESKVAVATQNTQNQVTIKVIKKKVDHNILDSKVLIDASDDNIV